MGIKSQREIAEQGINSHREPVNLYRGESPVRCLLLTAYILDWLLWHKNRKMGKKIFFEIFLKIMILKNLTSYEITISSQAFLGPKLNCINILLTFQGGKTDTSPSDGSVSFNHAIYFLPCCAFHQWSFVKNNALCTMPTHLVENGTMLSLV